MYGDEGIFFAKSGQRVKRPGWPAVALLPRLQAHDYADHDGAAARMLEAHLPALRDVRPQQIARKALANAIAEQEGGRAFSYAESIRHSTGETFARLGPEQLPDFLAEIRVPDAGQFRANTWN